MSMKKRKISVLSAAADGEALSPVLEELAAKGVTAITSDPAGDPASAPKGLLLAVLSKNFYADEGLQEALLSRVAASDQDVLPLQLDDAPVPDRLKNALYSRNIIPSSGREPALVAERIIAAFPEKKSRLPLFLIIGAAVLVIAAGFFIWKAAAGSGDTDNTEAPAREIAIPEGLTEEDLIHVHTAVIVGERMAFYTDEDGDHHDWSDLATLDENGHVLWYSNEDGSEISIAEYSDLKFLELMPNLGRLCMVMLRADADALPDLTKCTKLYRVEILSCDIGSLEFLRGSSISEALVRFSPVGDFGVLSSCDLLRSVEIDMFEQDVLCDFSDFAPHMLDDLWLWHARWENGGFERLGECAFLKTVTFGDLPLTDLSCLKGLSPWRLFLHENDSLRDISALRDLHTLRELEILYCPEIADYSPIAGCTDLQHIHLQCDENPDAVTDAGFLSELPHLNDIGLYSCDLDDMDFLIPIAQRQEAISFGFAGEIGDYSGLSAVGKFNYLHVNPRRAARGSDMVGRGDFSAVLPYIRDAQIHNLMLYDCMGVDLSQLPEITSILTIVRGDLTDLGGLKPYRLDKLELEDCQLMTSLSGIEALTSLKLAKLQVEVRGCFRLTDYSALSGAYLERLAVRNAFTENIPDYSDISADAVVLNNIAGLTELSCFDTLKKTDCDIELSDVNELNDISALSKHHGNTLKVPPQVADQAHELVEKGNYNSVEILYPEGSWESFDAQVELLSLDELETLPGALLSKVERLCIVGDRVMTGSGFDIWDEWSDELQADIPVKHFWESDETESFEYGPGTVESIETFSPLTGLRELILYEEPLLGLNGVQALGDLESLVVEHCGSLTDASAAFALQSLRYLNLSGCPVESLAGIQNLTELEELTIDDTKITDLTPLLELPGLRRVCVNRGMEEAIRSLDGAEYGFELEIW